MRPGFVATYCSSIRVTGSRCCKPESPLDTSVTGAAHFGLKHEAQRMGLDIKNVVSSHAKDGTSCPRFRSKTPIRLSINVVAEHRLGSSGGTRS